MQYIRRSVKYLLLLAVLYAAVMALMHYSGTMALPLEQTLWIQTHTWRGWVMLGAVVVLAAAYPFFGFVVRETRGSVERDREQIVRAFEASGFRLTGEDATGMTFRGDGLLTRLTLLFEDEIHVQQHGDCMRIEGIRRGVARVLFRLQGYIARGGKE